MYREHQPHISLSPFVDSYWTFTGFPVTGEPVVVFPDGCVDIIFRRDKDSGNFRPVIVGTMTSYIEVTSEYAPSFGVRFKPTGITAFTRVPVEEFTNRNVALELIDTLFEKSFFEVLPEKKSVEELMAYMNYYLMGQRPYLYHPDKQIIRAVDFIHFSKGQLPLSKVASEICLGQRHFERKFKSKIGVSPKTFAKIIRFKHAMRCLQHYPDKDLLSVAIECGYYDHTHLIKDFKALSGNTPTSLRC